MKKIIFLFVILFSWFGHASTGLNFRIHHEYQSPRALGMGDAFVAVANDYSAIFYNPAALARRDDGQINLYIGGGVATNFVTFVDELSTAANSTGTEAQKQEKFLNVLNNSYGDHYFVNVTMPNGFWVRPNWGVAVIPMNATLDMSIHKQLGPSLNVTGYFDTIVAYSLARDYYWFESGRTSLGVTLKSIYRGYLSSALSVVDFVGDTQALTQSNYLTEGQTLDFDIGMLFTPVLPTEGFFSLLRLTKPTFGMVIRNVLDYGFSGSMHIYNQETVAAKPEKLYRRIDLGSRWEYPDFLIFGGRGVLDIRDIMHPNFNLRKGLHLGFEFDWTMRSWWRGHYRFGLSQGYLTAGLSALFAWFNLDLVTYSEDVGSTNVPVESRKFEIRMNIDI